ncbi:hypothetical protein ACROYT_G038735 [Oculina patagonica]
MEQDRTRPTEIARRKWAWIGHTLRKPGTDTTKQALKWNPQGKRKVGRPAKTWRRSTEEELKKANICWNAAEKAAANRIQLDWKRIGAISIEQPTQGTRKKLARLLDEYEYKIGTLKSSRAILTLRKASRPKFCKARPVPDAMNPKVKVELKRLEKGGILHKVKFSHWATPIVPVAKSHGTVINLMVLSEGHPTKCLTNEKRRARRKFETILCRSKKSNWPRIQSLVPPWFSKLHENSDRSLKITGNPVFARSNKMLEAKLKALRREGKEKVQHKAVIESQDLIKINNSPFTSPNTPGGLLRKVWFFCTLYWCRRGSEGQRLLRRDSFQFEKDADGIEYVTMSHEELSKNHHGGFNDKTSKERKTRLYSTGQDGDAFSCFRKYVNKLNPKQEAFFQKPRANFQQSDQVCYENKPFGTNKLPGIMKQISIGAGLSKSYTNHCVRATAITLWSDSCVPARHIMSISGHANEQSLASYNSRPSTDQLKNCFDILSHALQKGRAPVARSEQTATACFPIASSATTTSAAVAQIPAECSVHGIFNSCNIGQAQVFILSQNQSKTTYQ